MKLFFEASPCFADDDTDGREALRRREMDELDALLREDPESDTRLKAASLFSGLRGSIDVDWGPWPDEAAPTVPEVPPPGDARLAFTLDSLTALAG